MNKKRVFIVEDDQLLATVLKRMAKKLNLDVIHVSSTGTEAVEKINQEAPDLIFMDILLADHINGIEAMKKVREKVNSPVIYISALSDHQIRSDAASVSNSYYMLKPVDLNELKIAISSTQQAA
jgi:DNA-binding response OmpR family regulator